MIDLRREFLDALRSDEGRSLLAELIKDGIEQARQSEETVMLDVNEAAELLRTTPAAMRKRAERGRVPHRRDGKRLLFRKADLVGAVRK